jgi:tRNA(Ile)-lysidine synthetase-like protein
MDLPGGLSLEREYDALVLRPRALPKEFLVRLTVPGITAVPELSLAVEAEVMGAVTLPPGIPSPQGRGAKERGPFEENYLWQAAFDYDKIASSLFIRGRRDGDRFCPAGMEGKSRKLQDYFTDKKIPQRKRDVVPILATEQDIVWVMGMRTDERFRVGAGTKRVLVVTVKRER